MAIITPCNFFIGFPAILSASNDAAFINASSAYTSTNALRCLFFSIRERQISTIAMQLVCCCCNCLWYCSIFMNEYINNKMRKVYMNKPKCFIHFQCNQEMFNSLRQIILFTILLLSSVLFGRFFFHSFFNLRLYSWFCIIEFTNTFTNTSH